MPEFLGEAIIEDLKRVVPNAEGVVLSVTTKTEMAASLRTLFEQKRIRQPNDRKLIMQINSLRYQVSFGLLCGKRDAPGHQRPIRLIRGVGERRAYACWIQN